MVVDPRDDLAFFCVRIRSDGERWATGRLLGRGGCLQGRCMRGRFDGVVDRSGEFSLDERSCHRTFDKGDF